MHRGESRPACLIVNADDYGFSTGISHGILEAAEKGAVTATGILATSPFFEEQARELLSLDRLDAGVHLNLTSGRLLTNRLAKAMGRSEGTIPADKFRLAYRILSGQIDVALVEEEWDAQIRRCHDAGIRIWFLNSHEHLHMLPPLFRLAHQLADLHGIPYVRYSSAEWFGFPKPSNLMRNAVLQVLDWVNRGNFGRPAARLIGVTRSGRMDLRYLTNKLPTLRSGKAYELMCHPGAPAMDEVTDPRLIAYHDWEGELNALLHAEARGFFRSGNIRLIGFRDLSGLLDGGPSE